MFKLILEKRILVDFLQLIIFVINATLCKLQEAITPCKILFLYEIQRITKHFIILMPLIASYLEILTTIFVFYIIIYLFINT